MFTGVAGKCFSETHHFFRILFQLGIHIFWSSVCLSISWTVSKIREHTKDEFYYTMILVHIAVTSVPSGICLRASVQIGVSKHTEVSYAKNCGTSIAVPLHIRIIKVTQSNVFSIHDLWFFEKFDNLKK